LGVILSLSTGAQIGPYTIGDEIGSGGMGVVYRATDRNLKRDVAIKALPESLGADAERLTRFQREAEVLASLNHPNIAQIYGLEKTDDTTALVMELVEGPTLADRIAKGPLPPDEALGIAMQIADALEAAHSRSIVHRDLKPANIKLRPDGTVKVLDFGIAKALEPESIRTEPQSPMLTTPATQVGVILGTAAYMSPEQAKGQPVDQRTDIWAFGCVLYEMLTGQLAFGAEDVPTTLARIIDRETNLDSLPGTISPAARQAIQLCLQKDARKRIADIRDVRLAIEGAFETSARQSADAKIAASRPWRHLTTLAATGVLSAVVGYTANGLWSNPRPEPRPVERFDYNLPPGQAIRTFQQRHFLSLSQDGSGFVYDTDDGLYLRTMSDLEARVIPGTEPPLAAPALSPDGQAVAYWDGANLRRIPVTGGAAVIIAEGVPNPTGLTWESDGTILFGHPQTGGIYRVAASGGVPELVIESDTGMLNYSPSLLSDGDSLLFTMGPTGNPLSGQIVVQSLTTGERHVLIEGGSEARYVPTGHLVYTIGDGLFAVPFDLDTMTVSGGPVPIVQGVMRTGAGGFANYSVADDGKLIYATGTVAVATRELVWVYRDGREEPISATPRAYSSPRLAPDGTKIALNARDEEQDIWIWDLTRQTLGRLTFGPAFDRFPVWSPDSSRVAYSTEPLETDGDFLQALDWRAADGTGAPAPLAESAGQIFPHAFLPDGSGILAQGDVTGANANDDIVLYGLDQERTVSPLLATEYAEQFPEVSPDGRWLAYSSDESGEHQVYVRPFPDVGAGRWQVSTDGGIFPRWSSDGQELFYISGDAMMAVAVEAGTSFTPGNPEMLFEGPYLNAPGAGGRTYDVDRNSERFLMIKPLDAATSTRVIIVQNWFEELRRLVPTP
jgi:serine/threonine protein kinase/Tol biopolymer transport system component